jgi:hypothetical protein
LAGVLTAIEYEEIRLRCDLYVETLR